MRNAHLSAVYNDPKLNRFRENSRLQPLFKKKFAVGEQTEMARATDSVPSLHPNPTEATLQTASIQGHYRPISGIKSETTDITRPSGELGVTELKTKLQRLKSERLELLKDLWTYEEKYDKKLSMRARLQEMMAYCNSLDEMTTSSLAHIEDEQSLYDKMLVGIESLKLRPNKPKAEEAGPQLFDDVEEGEERNFQEATVVSGLHCLAFVKYDKAFEKFTVIFHLDTACEVYSYELVNYRLPSAEFKRGGEFLKLALRNQLLPKFSITAAQDKLTLSFNEKPSREVRLLVQMTGSPFFYTQVLVTESSDGGDWVITLQEDAISTASVSLQVSKMKFGPVCELESITLSQQAQLAEEIRNRVSLLREDLISLALDIEQWRLEPPAEAAAKPVPNDFMKTVESPDLINDRYGSFEKLVAKGSVTVLNITADIEIYFNTVLELCRLTVTVDSIRRVIRAEEYPEAFDLLQLLQFESLETSPSTLLQSLELRYVLGKLFSE